MKSKLIMVILALSLTACLPTIENSRAGLGNSDIAKILMTASPIGAIFSATDDMRPRIKHHMITYCEEKKLSQSLNQCLTQMGLMCKENICRYDGYEYTIMDRIYGYNTKKEITTFYTITVNLHKGWDSFNMNRKAVIKEYYQGKLTYKYI